MVFSITWNDAFESVPNDDSYGNEIDTFLNNIKIGVRERMELEHVWKIGATDGQHIPGNVRAILVDTEANILIYSGKQGGIAYATDTKKIYRNTADGVNWTEVKLEHGGLSGLTDDDHTQYLLADGTRALTADLSAGGKKITNLATPTSDNDGSTKKYADDQFAALKPTVAGGNASDSNNTSSSSFVDVANMTADIDIIGTSDELVIEGYIFISTVADDSARITIRILVDGVELVQATDHHAINGQGIAITGYKTGLSAGTKTCKMQIKSVDSYSITYTYRSFAVMRFQT